MSWRTFIFPDGYSGTALEMSIEKTERMESTSVPANYWLDRARCKVGRKVLLGGGRGFEEALL